MAGRPEFALQVIKTQLRQLRQIACRPFQIRIRQPPDLTDPQSDHGSTDGDVFNNIKRGLPPTTMPGYDGRIPDEDIWNTVNYLRTLSAKQ